MIGVNDICADFNCAIEDTCIHPYCDGVHCLFDSICFVCEHFRRCDRNLFDYQGREEKEK
mgnify:FL=1